MDETIIQPTVPDGGEIPAQSAQNVDSLPTENVQPQDGQPTETPPAEVKKDGVRKRIDELTAEKWTAKRENEDLKSRLDALEAQTKAQAQTPQPGTADKAPNRNDYVDDEEYLQALVSHNTAIQVQSQMSTVRQQQEQETTLQERNRRISETSKKLAEGGARIETEYGLQPGDFQKIAFNTSFPYTAQMKNAIESIDDPASVAYYLARNPDVGNELSFIQDPVAVAVRIGQIQVQARNSKKPEPRAVSQAAAPINPVTPGAGRVNYTQEDYIKMPMSDFMRTIREENAAKGII